MHWGQRVPTSLPSYLQHEVIGNEYSSMTLVHHLRVLNHRLLTLRRVGLHQGVRQFLFSILAPQTPMDVPRYVRGDDKRPSMKRTRERIMWLCCRHVPFFFVVVDWSCRS